RQKTELSRQGLFFPLFWSLLCVLCDSVVRTLLRLARSEMTFVSWSMLLGTLAAGIPIALHFFYRSRFRNVPWAAMKFLLAALDQTSRRLKFQELLLLLLRIAVMLLIAFAVARPMLTRAGSGRGDAVDAVLVIDRSMSMSARAGVAPQGDDLY